MWVSAGENILSNELFEQVQEKERKKEQQESDKRQKNQDQEDQLKQKVKEVHMKNKQPEQWTAPNLKTMVKWHKHPRDNMLPASKAKLLEHY